MDEADQADADYRTAVVDMRPEWLGQDLRDDIRFGPEIDQNAAVNAPHHELSCSHFAVGDPCIPLFAHC